LSDVPAGFIPLPSIAPGDFNSLILPVYVKAEGRDLVGGFRVEKHHCNPGGMCHGGMMATFCDVHMAWSAVYQHDLDNLLLPTISLSFDYLAPVPLGTWVEGRVQVLRVGRRIVFAQEMLTVDGAPVLRASGCFSRSPPDERSAPLRAGLRALLRGG
jgi:uncharacterized protein (TIGR00369 family)